MIGSEPQLFEVVRRGGNRAPGSWIGIVSLTEPDEILINEIRSEAETQFNPRLLAIDIRETEPFALAREMNKLDNEWVLLHGFEHWTPARWHAAELNRNSWLRGGLNWFLLSPAAVSNIARYAPNVKSLIGSYLVIGPDQSQMSAEECETRLTQLREHYGMSDDQIIAAAENHELEMTPHLVEWLILSDRGDLV